ncbi:MAG: LacI family transcriptional regulator [Rariglobus sp.]|nr:LacI family transcriptional regulator [Rariglobus sp.]
MTVSRALRNDPAISPETTKRVRVAAAKIGYRPNPLISAYGASLRAGHRAKSPPLIAFFTAAATEHGWRKAHYSRGIYDGAEARAVQLGYGLSPIWIAQPGMTERRLDQILRARGVQGVIVGTMEPLSRVPLDWARFAVAVAGYTLAHPAFHRVASNHSQTMTLVLRMLAERGYRRIGLALSERTDQRTDHLILGSYRAWQFLQPREEEIAPCYQREPDEEQFVRWLEESRPEVVMITERIMHSWLQKRGLKIPGELGVVLLEPDRMLQGLACIQRDFAAMGAALVDLVVDQLHRNERGVPAVPKIVSVATTWREGRSIRAT